MKKTLLVFLTVLALAGCTISQTQNGGGATSGSESSSNQTQGQGGE